MNTTPALRDPLVRDLYWALSSPPLSRRADRGIHWPDPDWFHAISLAFQPQLAKLDADPQPLRAAVNGQKDRRLGNYFETLWRFWLTNNERYRLLRANLPVRTRDRTLGEFDLLVEDRATGRTLHWELAVKFYLGVGDTARPENWWGPAQRDRLDLKTHRMIIHQSKLSQQPEAATLLTQLGIHIDETWVILKGRLFYPAGQPAIEPHDAQPQHLRGFWVSTAVFSRFEEALWLPLDRHQWLAPQTEIEQSTCLRGSDIAAQWRHSPLRRPLCLARVENAVEIERGFVVPDDWSPVARTAAVKR
jgi:hypothetical protein